MTIKKTELEQKWYFRGAKVIFWVLQVVVAVTMITLGKGNAVDLIMGFVVYTVILIGLWKLILYVIFGGVENDKVNIETK